MMTPQTARTLIALAATLYPAWGAMMNVLVPAAVDPLWERLALSALMFSCWPLLRDERRASLTLHLLLALVALHFGLLVVRNDFAPPYAVGQLVLLGSLGAAVSARSFVVGLTLVFVAQPLLAPRQHTDVAWVLSLGAVTVGLVQWVVLRARAMLLAELDEAMAAERAREEKLRHVERLATLGTVAATVGHELNNPLSWVAGNLSFLDRELPADGDPELALAVKESLDGVAKLSTIVRDLKLLARREEVVSVPFDPCSIARGAATLVRAQIEQRARFTVELGAEVPLVEGDGNRLAQVIINLLVNAAQALPPGSAPHHTVTLSVAADEQRVRLSVKDSGPGIPAEVQPHIFEPFFTTKPTGEGTGLGLAVCREVIGELGGTLRYQTSADGTCFTVELPACQVPAIEEPTSLLWPAGRGLVIDDENNVRQGIRRAMAQSTQLTLCGDVDEAIAALRSNEAWDFVLCDVMMPGQTAVDFVARLDAEFPHLRGKLVLMTGGAFTERERTFLEGIDVPVLQKPFTMDALRRAIEQVSHPRPTGSHHPSSYG